MMLRVSIPVHNQPKITLERIIKTACEALNLKREDVLGKVRKTELATARHIIFSLARQHTRLHLVQIGQPFGVDHSSVINGSERCNEKKDIYADYREKYNAVKFALLDDAHREKLLA